MDITVEQLPKSRAKVSVTVTPGEMSGYFKRATRMLSEQVQTPGFRKGKAPRAVVEKRVGKEYLDHQALELAITDSYYEAVKKHDLKPISRPKTDITGDGHHDLEKTGLTYVAEVAVLPKITLGDYQSVRVKPAVSTYTEKLVDETITELQQARASFKETDRPARKGDRVEIDFVGMLKGKEIPGGKSENHPLVIGEDNFIPGFADELIGQQKGQVKKFKMKFPKDYHETSLAGKQVEFTVTTRKVEEVSLPSVNDKFAKQFGADTLAQLKTRLTDNLQQEKQREAEAQTESAVLEQVLAKATVEPPDLLVEEELNKMFSELRRHIESQGIPFDKYLEHMGKEESALRNEQRPEAERRVKTSLILNAIQEAEGIAASDKDVDLEVAQQLAQAPDDATKEQIQSDEFRNYVRRVLGNRRVMQSLLKTATNG